MRRYLLPVLCTLFVFLFATRSNGQTITTYAGNGTYGFSGDGGSAISAQIRYVWFIAIDSTGNTYFTDYFDHRARKVNTSGTISTLAGNGLTGSTGDGGLAISAEFIGVSGTCVDKAGNIYIGDINNSKIRKINSAGLINTFAGNGSTGFSGDGGPASGALLNSPYGLAIDDTGNIFVSDELNYRVRKITPAGIISTVAGNGTGGYSGDGGSATAAQITPTGIAVDHAGNVFIATNNRIRKISSAGIITTVAGNGIAGYSGDGGSATAAKLNQPVGIATDGLGNLYISDQYNYRIRKVNTSGIITTIAGNGTAGFMGDGGPATAAEINQPLGLCLDPSANIYFSDYANHKIRKINYNNHIPAFINWPADSASVCENSVADSINDLMKIFDADSGQNITWTLIAPALHGTATIAHSAISAADTITPSGLTYTPAAWYSGYDTFKVRVDDGHSLDTLTIYIRVKPLPDSGIITGSTDVCMGTPTPLADTAIGGVWSATNTVASISSTGIVTGNRPGMDTIHISFLQEGCSSSTSTVVTVYPVTDTVTGPVAVCTGLSIPLHGSPSGGAWNVTNTLARVLGGTVYGDTAGVDTVIYTIANVCGIFSTMYPVTVIGFSIPSLVISATPTTIVHGEYDTITAHILHGGGISYGYQWQVNSHDIIGATDSVYISDSLLNNDSVSCTITNGPCNFSTFSWTYIVYHNDGVRIPGGEINLRLAPNPSHGDFTLDGKIPTESNHANIEISDATGRVVYRDDAEVNNGLIRKRVSLDEQMGNGVYFLQLITNDAKKVVRFTLSR